jgi:N-acetylmuramoyl-L-alanine amidase
MKEKVFVVWMSHWRWRKVWLLLALAGWGLFFVASPAVSQAADLRSVRLGGDSVSTRLVLDLSGEAAGRLLSDAGGKIVVSLADAEVEAPMRGPGRGLVRAWSVTPQAGGGARLSVETAVGVTVRRRFLLPPGEGSPGYRYVIDFEMASPLKVPGETVRLTSLKETSGSATAAPRKSAKSRLDSRKIVVIDAGHGGTGIGGGCESELHRGAQRRRSGCNRVFGGQGGGGSGATARSDRFTVAECARRSRQR